MSVWLAQPAHLAMLAAPSPSPGLGGGTSAIQVWTLVVAGLAVLATLVTAFFARRTGEGQVEAARQAAAASERSAEAAQESVGVNRETAAGVAQRAQADALAKRYQDAAAQLGHEQAPVRLAGVYEMARLADDWPPQQQTCIDVLCAYLRMPYDKERPGEEEVRSSIIGLIGDHLRSSGKKDGAWSHLKFKFDRADMGDGGFRAPIFRSEVSFDGATFGNFDFWGPMFHSGVSFWRAKVNTRVELVGPTFKDDFSAAYLHIGPDGYFGINLGSTGRPITVDLDDLTVEGKMQILISKQIRPERISMHRLTAGPGCLIIIEYERNRGEAEDMEWFELEGWKVGLEARIWLPPGTDLRDLDSDDSASIVFGPFGSK